MLLIAQIDDDGDEMLERQFDDYRDAKAYYDKLKRKKSVSGKTFLDDPSSYVRVGMKGSGKTASDLPKQEL